MSGSIPHHTQASTRTRRGARRGDRLVAAFLFVDGIAILSIWVVSLSGGAFGGLNGLLHYQEGNYPIFHVLAETLMGCVALTAAVRLWRDDSTGHDLALLANGLLIYSTINSSGWPLHNDLALLLPMVLTLLGNVASVAYLLRRAPRR